MKWALVALLSSFAAAAQTPTQNASPKLEPYQVKALENALRRSGATAANGFSGPFTAVPLSVMLAAPSAPVQLAKACAIPLLSVPVATDVDRGIRRELKPDALAADAMPVFKGLPSCQEDNQPAR